MKRYFAFYRSDMHTVSPLVCVSWRKSVVDLLNRLPKSPNRLVFAGGGGDMPESWCVDFVTGCCALTEVGRDKVELWNWWPREDFDACGLAEDTPSYEVAFVSWLDRQAKSIGYESPVFISTLLPLVASPNWEKLALCLPQAQVERNVAGMPHVAYRGGAELCRLIVEGIGPDRRGVWVVAPRSRKKKTAEPGC
jgi:hypothetical protein